MTRTASGGLTYPEQEAGLLVPQVQTFANDVARLVAGRASLNLAGSGDYTVGVTAGVADDTRTLLLSCTGLQTAQRDLIMPTTEMARVLLVYNNTTGGFAVRVKRAGQTVGIGSVSPSRARLFFFGETDWLPLGAEFDPVAGIEGAGTADSISGLKLSWNSATSISIGTGAASLPSGQTIRVDAAITKAGLSLSASTLYHVYLYMNAGTPDAEVVTTAPASYFGSAHQKTSDATRRYLGSIRTDGSSNLYRFTHFEGRMFYDVPTNASPFRVLNGLSATSLTNVSCAGVVPVTARMAAVRLAETGGQVADIGHSGDSGTFIFQVDGGGRISREITLDSSQQFRYKVATGAGVLYVDVLGYVLER